jgi:hypothetical protein
MAERKLEFKDNIHLSQLAVRVDQEETDDDDMKYALCYFYQEYC